MNDETITAISTPLGYNAIGIVRISGKDAIKILNNIFRSTKSQDLFSVPSHTVLYGHIFNNTDGKTPIDEVLATIMRAPRTYTKEDMVEISCHGNPILLQNILGIVLKAGAKPAEPGEFTKRAFMNGRIDLSQAEAVIDLINAKTEEASKLALKHLNGTLSRYAKNLQDSINEILIMIESNIEFIEDGVSEINYKLIKEKLFNITSEIQKLIKSYDHGSIIKNGITCAIIGKTNVGKSSLLNILTGNPQRALVTHIPGTTRDLIEELVSINGTFFRFFDTAGLKKPKGIIEEKSIDITLKCIEDAMCVIFIIDGSKPLGTRDIEIWKKVLNKPNIIAINKIDLKQKTSSEKVQKTFSVKTILGISCKDNIGIEKLKDSLLLLSKNICSQSNDSEVIINNFRHKNLLEKAGISIKDAISAIENKLSLEFIASDLKNSIEYIQELTGERVTGNILDDIFSKFCIGK